MAATLHPAIARGAVLAVLVLALWLSAPWPPTAEAQRVQVPLGGAAPFDPYALGAPPATALPYTYSAPITTAPAAPVFSAPAAPAVQAAPFTAPGVAPSASSAPLFSGAPSLGWQSGTYTWQRNDGTTQTFTKFVQQLSIEHAYLHGDSNDARDVALNETEIASTFAYPLGGNVETPLLITPGFAFNFFNGPIGGAGAANIPGDTYDAYLDASWFPQPLPAFAADLGLRVGVYSDFSTVNSDSIRVLGRGLGVVKLTPTLDVIAGVVYLDRVDVKLLPAGGFHYKPNDLWDFYAVFPSPRVSRQLQSRGGLNARWFVAGEYGGGSWTGRRIGLNDRFDYNDLRVTTGVEWETAQQRRGSVEIGYVFDRELVFASGAPNGATVDDTFILRAGIDL